LYRILLQMRAAIFLLSILPAHPSSFDASFLRPSHAQRWEVALTPPSAAAGGTAGAPSPPPQSTHYMVDGAGVRWRCVVPLVGDGAGGNGGGGGGGAPPPPGAPAGGAPLERALAALAALHAQGACALKPAGYWTFQVCAGGRVRQFHVEELALPKGESLDLGSHAPARDRVETLPGGTRALTQRFEGGDGGRAADVQWVCGGGAAAAAAAVAHPPAFAAVAAAAGGAGGGAAPPPPPPLALEVLSAEEAPPLTYTLRVGVRSAALCAALPSPPTLLAPINNTCIEHSPGGWWSYSVCLGREVTQFHVEAGKRVQETVLGRYNWAQGEALVGEGQPGTGVGAGAAPLAPLGAAAITQSYVEGAPCPVRGGAPRSATVRFECMPLGAGGALGEDAVGALSLTFLHMREAPTCAYTFVFGSPLPCEVTAPASAHLPPPPVAAIDCQRAA
jgi:hypothetical protein